MNTQRKTILALAASLAFVGGMAIPLQASAQATPQAAAAPQLPAGWRVILNNDQVRVFENTFAPGVVYPMTNYLKRTVYVVKGSGPMSYTYADGKTETVTQQAGVASSRERKNVSYQYRNQRHCAAGCYRQTRFASGTVKRANLRPPAL